MPPILPAFAPGRRDSDIGALQGRGPRSALRGSKDLILDDRPRVQPPSRDEQRLVDPVVARIARLEPRTGPEVVIVPLARTLPGVRGLRSFRVLDHAEVLHV